MDHDDRVFSPTLHRRIMDMALFIPPPTSPTTHFPLSVHRHFDGHPLPNDEPVPLALSVVAPDERDPGTQSPTSGFCFFTPPGSPCTPPDGALSIDGPVSANHGVLTCDAGTDPDYSRPFETWVDNDHPYDSMPVRRTRYPLEAAEGHKSAIECDEFGSGLDTTSFISAARWERLGLGCTLLLLLGFGLGVLGLVFSCQDGLVGGLLL